jgi:hypothetical protein
VPLLPEASSIVEPTNSNGPAISDCMGHGTLGVPGLEESGHRFILPSAHLRQPVCTYDPSRM